jgi:hypothetical protein
MGHPYNERSSLCVCLPACLSVCLSVEDVTIRKMQVGAWNCGSSLRMNVTYAALNMIKIRRNERSQAMPFYPYRMMSDLSIIVAAIFIILPFLVVFAKLRKANINFLISICPSVSSHGTTRLPADRFSWNYVFGYFSKACLENSSFIKMWQKQRIFYVKTVIPFRSELTRLFLE